MFTGIIETVGTVLGINQRGNYSILRIKPDSILGNLDLGESMAIDGCCLTVTGIFGDEFTVEASPESRETTIIDSYDRGTQVNLERSLLPTSRMGGHFVTGHIDTVGSVAFLRRESGVMELSIRFPLDFSRFLVPKGSVAVNGISLTVNKIQGDIFTLNLIPYTRQITTIDRLKAGVSVNLEFDLIGKYAAHFAGQSIKSDLTLEKLINSGW